MKTYWMNVALVVPVLATLGGCGGADGADSKAASSLDRRAPDQQRELAKIVDAYYAGWVRVLKEAPAASGNPIQQQKVDRDLAVVKVKVWDDMAALMSKSSGKFDGWIGTLSFAQIGSWGVEQEHANLVFAPDGILSRDMSTGGPIPNAPPLILLRAGLFAVTQDQRKFEDTRPLMTSPFVQSLGAVDLQKKVKVRGELIMTGYPPPTCTAAGKVIAFHCVQGSADSGPPFPIVARFTAISNL